MDDIDRALLQDGTELPGPMPVASTALGDLGASSEVFVRKQTSLWADAGHRLIRNRLAIIGLFIVLLFIIVAILAPWLAPYGENEVIAQGRLRMEKPSWTWPFGLDANSRDIFSRMMYGSRVSMMVGVVAYLIILIIAIPVGSIAGYYGGKVDLVLMRIVDVIFTIPQVLLVLMFVNWRGSGLVNIFLAIGLIGWVNEARLIRGQFLTLREQEYVRASRVAGASGPYIIMRHLLPNSLTPIIVAATFGIPTAIFTEAAISFVGVGIQPPAASWGQMVGDAANPAYVQSNPHLLIFPVLAIGLTMLGFTFLGDGLRDALDPKGND